jgi:integrase
MENVYRLPVPPQTEKRTVRNRRPPNAALRTREYLTPQEVNALVEAARKNPYGHCDATMILIAYRHGLRASELCGLRWEQAIYAPPICTSPGSRLERLAPIH